MSPFLSSFFTADKDFYRALKRILGYSPRHFALYKLAFVHRSAAVVDSNGDQVDNERLEFLGDAIIDAVIAHYLYRHFPGKDEGFLTKMRSKIVNRSFMDDLAAKLGLDELLITQIGQAKNKKHLNGNAFEALVGAIYLDRGYDRAQNFILNKVIKEHINLPELAAQENNYKSILVEWGQRQKSTITFDTNEIGTVPSYFLSHAKVNDEIIGTGKGFSKKEAEQCAAENAIAEMETNKKG